MDQEQQQPRTWVRVHDSINDPCPLTTVTTVAAMTANSPALFFVGPEHH
ncbi:hypothetical protein [Streptomyces sp. NPDC004579]